MSLYSSRALSADTGQVLRPCTFPSTIHDDCARRPTPMDPSTSTSVTQQPRTRPSAPLSTLSPCPECSPARHAPAGHTYTHAHAHLVCQCHDSPPATSSAAMLATTHSSPRSAPTSLPSPPDSPPLDPYSDADLDSLSSFPSVSSSIFFSSGAGSSPHTHAQYQYQYADPHSGHLYVRRDQELDISPADGFIIPSLALPAALPHPTAYGQALGDASFLILGPAGANTGILAEYLADADDIVDVAAWETVEPEGSGGSRARVLRASTDWIEECDAHGLERFEGTANVALVELDSFDAAEKVCISSDPTWACLSPGFAYRIVPFPRLFA